MKLLTLARRWVNRSRKWGKCFIFIRKLSRISLFDGDCIIVREYGLVLTLLWTWRAASAPSRLGTSCSRSVFSVRLYPWLLRYWRPWRRPGAAVRVRGEGRGARGLRGRGVVGGRRKGAPCVIPVKENSHSDSRMRNAMHFLFEINAGVLDTWYSNILAHF